MTIKIYKSNDGKPPLKIIGGNVFYIYSDEIEKIFIYSNSNDKISMFNCECKKIIITYQPDESLFWNLVDVMEDSQECYIG